MKWSEKKRQRRRLQSSRGATEMWGEEDECRHDSDIPAILGNTGLALARKKKERKKNSSSRYRMLVLRCKKWSQGQCLQNSLSSVNQRDKEEPRERLLISVHKLTTQNLKSHFIRLYHILLHTVTHSMFLFQGLIKPDIFQNTEIHLRSGFVWVLEDKRLCVDVEIKLTGLDALGLNKMLFQEC